jgi:long-chain acyl-CoA synthetase
VFCALIDDFFPEQIIETLNETNCRILIYDERLTLENLKQLVNSTNLKFFIPIDGQKGIRSYHNLIKNSNDSEPQTKIKPDEISAIGFTSGTTGKSKGIVWTHKAWLYSFYHLLLNSDSSADMIFLHAIPFSTAGSLVILPALASGARNILMRSFDPQNVADVIDREKVTNLILPPSFLIELWDFYVNNKGKYDFKSLKNIGVGSAILPGNKWKEMIPDFGPILQQSYGMAEVLAPIASLKISDPEAEKYKLTSVGKVINQVKIKLKDVDAAGLAVHGSRMGIIYLRSKTCGVGYLGKEKLTQQHFQKGWFATNDIGCLDDNGNLHIIERASNIYIHDGVSIIPREIEEIIHCFKGVKEALVTKIDNDLVAYVSARRNLQIDLNQLKEFCTNHISAEKVPTKYILLDCLPHSTSGKILRKNLMVPEECNKIHKTTLLTSTCS